MFFQLPPVGNKVRFNRTSNTLPVYLADDCSRFYGSGTASLAAAIQAAISASVEQRIGRTPDEVILPAYACPDLVSAVLYCNAKPVLVDMEPERPWMNLSRLEEKINEKTVAIVGVNLFGLAERWPTLRKLADKYKLVLIEDSAQYFPAGNEEINWQGDMVVFSFGRGKPVSLLGGGAVYSRNPAFMQCLPEYSSTLLSLSQAIKFKLKARLYNLMISPYLYWLPQSMPFLHLGETRFHALHEITAMDELHLDLLPSNMLAYQQDTHNQELCRAISAQLAEIDSVIDLPAACEMHGRHLLRYPVLVDPDQRDIVYRALLDAGLGPSILYPTSLPNIQGLEQQFFGQKEHQANVFASRLITLPLHSHVSLSHIYKMTTILRELL